MSNVKAQLTKNTEDIIPLIHQFIKEADEQIGTGPKELSKDAETYLLSGNWYGKEKELGAMVKKACILSDKPQLLVDDFDLGYRHSKSVGQFVESKLKGFMSNIKRFEKFNLYDMVIPEVERSLIVMVLRETKGNQLKAARLLGINRNTLRSKIKKLKIKVKGLK